MAGNVTIQHQNPAGMHTPRGYTHVVAATAPARIAFISGQIGVAADGKLAPDFRTQAEQAFSNLATALAAAGGGFENVTKMTVFFTDIASQIGIYREVRDRHLGSLPPPASTALGVAALAAPGMLFEIEAVAVLPA
jgi:enamine deaminase RidA (YjgF/YER057c/UK114 family)